MITLKQRNRLVRAINKLRRADVAASWARGGDPADWDYLEAQPKILCERLNAILDEITRHAPPTRNHP